MIPFSLQRRSTLRIWCAGFIAFLVFLAPVRANASFIRIMADARVYVDEIQGMVEFSATIRNDGDETAKTVSIAFAPFNERVPVTTSLSPKESTLYLNKFEFQRLGIKEKGLYSLPFQMSYADSNGYQFSAVYITQLVYEVSPPKVLFIDLGDAGNGRNPLELKGRRRTAAGVIRNVSRNPVEITSIEPFSSSEIPAVVRNISLPVTLGGAESISFELDLDSAGALTGSQYPVFVIVSGRTSDTHFSELSHVAVQIVAGRSFSRIVMLSMFGVVLLCLLVPLVRKRMKKENGSTLTCF